jgi:hypothetical protein
VCNREYCTDCARRQPENSLADEFLIEPPVWRLNKIWRGSQGVGNPVWTLSYGNAELTMSTRHMIDGDWLWPRVFAMSGQQPPWRLGDRAGARQWLQPLLDRCPL